MTKTTLTIGNISELTNRKQWVCWKRGRTNADGRFEKIPCAPDFPPYSIDAQDPSMHMSYEDALWAADAFLEIEGIAFVPSKEDPFCFLDLDHIVDPETGKFKAWVARIVETLDSFAYITPSGKGLRIVIRGELTDGGGDYVYSDEEGDHDLEAYDSNQFLTFTHKIWDRPIREAQELLDSLTKARKASPQKGSDQDFPEVTLDEDLKAIRREVKRTLVAHELSPEPIVEGFRKSTLISVGGHLLMDGKSEEWLWEFLQKINVTLLYNKQGELEGLDKGELEEIHNVVTKLEPKVSPVEVQQRLDLVLKFLSLIRPRMKRAFNTDWNFLKALETQGRKYGSLVREDEVRIDGSWLTLQGLSRIVTAKTFGKKISRLKTGGILTTGKDKQDKTGHFVLNVSKLLSGEYFGLSEQGIERMREDSKVMCINNMTNQQNHYFTILRHPFWTRQYGNARGPLFAAIASLGGGGRTGEIARIMGRVDENGKPKCGSISGLLRKCEEEGTLNNPRRGYWEFSEDFEDKLYKARVDAGEFDRDADFDSYKRDKRKNYREEKSEYLKAVRWQDDLFEEMLLELEKENPLLWFRLALEGAPKPMWVLGKYFVEGRRVTGIMGHER
jgi:hypothetical protein